MQLSMLTLSPTGHLRKTHRYAEIDNMGVSPAHRGKGIGSMLIDKAKEWAKEKGYTRLFVSSYWANEQARGFYRKNGGKEIDVSFDLKI